MAGRFFCQVKKWGELTLETTDHVGVLQDQGKDQGKLGKIRASWGKR